MTSRNDQLNQEDWIKAGFRALTAGGPEAVKVEKIARELGVSKGSFYWHFKSQAALKFAMMTHWEAEGTQAIIDRNEEGDLGPREKLIELGAMITNNRELPSGGLPYGGLLMESAIRDWSRFDEEIGAFVRRVNASRLTHIAKLFSALGYSGEQSKLKAKIVYSSMIGLEFLEHQDLASLEADMAVLLDVILQSQDEGGA